MSNFKKIIRQAPFWSVLYPAVILLALWAALVGAFVWKMIYHPESVVWVILELSAFTIISFSAIWCLLKNYS